MKVQIRLTAAPDAPAIGALHVASWQSGHGGLFPDEVVDRVSLEEREHVWRQEAFTEEERGFVWVAERQEEIVGFTSSGFSRDFHAIRLPVPRGRRSTRFRAS